MEILIKSDSNDNHISLVTFNLNQFQSDKFEDQDYILCNMILRRFNHVRVLNLLFRIFFQQHRHWFSSNKLNSSHNPFQI